MKRKSQLANKSSDDTSEHRIALENNLSTGERVALCELINDKDIII